VDSLASNPIRRPRAHPAAGLALALLGSCSGGAGAGGAPGRALAESESNDTAASADAVPLGRPATGSLATLGDVDFWSVVLAEGELYQVELFAARLDQAAWSASGAVPRLTIYDASGSSKLVEHDFGGFTSSTAWGWGAHDLDVPLFRAPANGAYFVAVRPNDPALAGGNYVFAVEALALVVDQNEAELGGAPDLNEDTDDAETIVPGLIRGRHSDGDVDFYSFAVSEASLLRFELVAYQNGLFGGDESYYDPRLDLVAPNGTTLLATNDDVYFYDSAIHHELDVPGTYFVSVGECCGSGDAEYFLRFELETLASALGEAEDNDTPASAQVLAYGQRIQAQSSAPDPDVFAFAATAGDLVRLQRFDGRNSQGAAELVSIAILAPDGATPLATDEGAQLGLVTFLIRASGTHFVEATSPGGATSYLIELELVSSSAFESEGNDSVDDADPFDAAGRAAGVIAGAGDLDLFALQALEGRPLVLEIYAARSNGSDGFAEHSGHGSELDPRLRVLDAAGAELARMDFYAAVGGEGVLAGLPTEALAFLPPANATYFVEVSSAAGAGGPDHHFLIEVR
jgi:hypothetical protein